MALNPRQEEAIAGATARLNILHGSVRSGKSFARNVLFAHALASRDRLRGDAVLIAKTLRTMRRNVVGPLEDLLGTKAVRVRWGDGIATILGHEVELVTANDERAEQKVRGGTFEIVAGDELTLWPESLFRMVLSRMSVEGAQFFGDTNPDAPRHWLKRDFLDRSGELDLYAAHFRLRDNLTLPEDYIRSLELEYTGLWRKRFIEGLWVIAEGAIWDCWDEDRHCFDEVPDGTEIRRYWTATDYGTSNPFVSLLFAQDTTGRIWVLDEWRWDGRARHRQLTDAEYDERTREWLAGHGITPVREWVDPSAASYIAQMRKSGRPATPADNEVIDGLRTVGTMLQQDRIRIARRCEGLLSEIPGYCWDERAQEKGEDKPIKIDDHGPDALRYGVYSHIGKTITGAMSWA